MEVSMHRRAALLIAVPCLACLGLASVLQGAGQDSRNFPEARIPAFPMKALSSPAAKKAGIFVSKDGTITRYTVHLDREGVPPWLHDMADEKIGKGDDLAYEAELYPDGSEVYEIYRMVAGKEKQLSVEKDRTVKYVGTQVGETELPDRVQATLQGVKGFFFEKCILKEGPRFGEYHVKGMLRGVPHRIRIATDGRLLAVQRRIPAEFEVAVQE
jgi:hypothetical protein